MKYMLLMYANKSEAPKSPEEYQAVAQAWYTFGQEAEAAGVLVSNNGLSPVADATTVRVREGKGHVITDGPFAETHEQLGGYYLFDCQDLDEVLRWAARIPLRRLARSRIRRLNQWSQK